MIGNQRQQLITSSCVSEEQAIAHFGLLQGLAACTRAEQLQFISNLAQQDSAANAQHPSSAAQSAHQHAGHNYVLELMQQVHLSPQPAMLRDFAQDASFALGIRVSKASFWSRFSRGFSVVCYLLSSSD